MYNMANSAGKKGVKKFAHTRPQNVRWVAIMRRHVSTSQRAEIKNPRKNLIIVDVGG